MIHLMDIVEALHVVREEQRGETQRVPDPHLAVVGDVGLEAKGGHLPLAAVRLVEADPAEELVGREVEDDEVIADVHVPVVVDPPGSDHIPVAVQRRVDHTVLLLTLASHVGAPAPGRAAARTAARAPAPP